MATLPRTTKQSSTPASARIPAFDQRPHSDLDFDAGINSSAAWTEHLDRGYLSDDEPTDHLELHGQRGLSARALYQFEGKVEFRELTVEAGDELEVLKQDVGDGWSLVKTEDGKIGLLPRAYYTVGALPERWRRFQLTPRNSTPSTSSLRQRRSYPPTVPLPRAIPSWSFLRSSHRLRESGRTYFRVSGSDCFVERLSIDSLLSSPAVRRSGSSTALQLLKTNLQSLLLFLMAASQRRIPSRRTFDSTGRALGKPIDIS